MSYPSVPSRPHQSDSGGLVSSRVKAFANAAASTNNKTPPALPAKPTYRPSASPKQLPSTKQIHQTAQILQTFDANRPSRVTKAPPPLPKNVAFRPPSASTVVSASNMVRNSSSDFSVKDMKSKFESAANVVSSMPPPSNRQIPRVRPVSEFYHPQTAITNDFGADDFNNNATTKVKSLRAELESKLTIRSPNSGPIHIGGGGGGGGAGESSNMVDYHSYQQPQQQQQQMLISSSYTEGLSYSKPNTYHHQVMDERPVLPTLSAKSKPPPRPPPCSLPSRVSPESSNPNRQSKYGAYGDSGQNYGALGTYPSGHVEYSRTPSPQEASAMVAYDFLGEQSDELTSKRGDNLILKHEVDEEWFYAYNTRTGRTGIIPKGFVDVKAPLPSIRNTHPQSDEDSGVESTADGPRCYTLHDFISNVAGDLTFLKGEVIKLVSRVNDEWLEGESHDGRRGIFPITFVEIIEDLPTMSPGYETYGTSTGSKRVDSGIVTALYDFHGENPGDLSFMAGEKVSVKAMVNVDWLYGTTISTNRSGIFPTSFVDRVPPNLPLFDSQ